MELKENVIEFLTGEKMLTFTFSNYSHINHMKKLYESNKDAFDYFIENPDGSICGKVPLKWLKKLSPPVKREYTEEQKAVLSERMKNLQNKRVKKNKNEEV